jgi:hypothetical protein
MSEPRPDGAGMPPENDAAREASPTCPGPSVKRPSQNPTRHQQGNAHDGRYAEAWRAGFGRGFRDALRLAGRRLPVEHSYLIDALADEYSLACRG